MFQRTDLVVVVLVGHFVPDDGARTSFMSALAFALAASGAALVVELEAGGDAQECLIDSHVHFSRRAGVPENRLTVVRERLTTGFHLIGRDRWVALAEQAGLVVQYVFFRVLCAFGMLVGRR